MGNSEKNDAIYVFLFKDFPVKISWEKKIFQMWSPNSKGTNDKIYFRYLHSVQLTSEITGNILP